MASSPTEKTGDPVLDDQATSDTELAGPKINEKALLRKIDAHLLPAVGILYLLSFLDRSNGVYPMIPRRVGTKEMQITNVRCFAQSEMLVLKDCWTIPA